MLDSFFISLKQTGQELWLLETPINLSFRDAQSETFTVTTNGLSGPDFYSLAERRNRLDESTFPRKAQL